MGFADALIDRRHVKAFAQRDAGAADQRTDVVLQHVLGQARPQHGDHRPTPVIRMNAGAADFRHTPLQTGQRPKMKLVRRVETAGFMRALPGQHPGVADQLAALVIAHHQVQAMAVEAVPVQTERRVEAGAVLLGKDPITQTLNLQDLPAGPGKISAEPSACFRPFERITGLEHVFEWRSQGFDLSGGLRKHNELQIGFTPVWKPPIAVP